MRWTELPALRRALERGIVCVVCSEAREETEEASRG